MTEIRRRQSPLPRIAGVTLLALTTFIPASANASDTPPAARADDGAAIVRESRLNQRMLDLDIDSPALAGRSRVRLLLPPDFDSRPDFTWPSLYMLHGCCEAADYTSWTHFTDIEAFTADKPVLVVMPSDGRAGMFSAWWNAGKKTIPDWETFHVTEVRQLLERNYRAGGQRAVAGISIGGYGAMAYTFRHPELFSAAASYSGLPNTLGPGTPTVIKTMLFREGFDPNALWGDEIANLPIWQQHNPHDNAERLRGKALFVSSGNGTPGPFDQTTGADPQESGSFENSTDFTAKLNRSGIAVTTDYYGNGTHKWPYWQRELHRCWPLLAQALRLGHE